jgi:hypothetical protein
VKTTLAISVNYGTSVYYTLLMLTEVVANFNKKNVRHSPVANRAVANFAGDVFAIAAG